MDTFGRNYAEIVHALGRRVTVVHYSAQLPYVMGIDYESRGAMLPPQVNISERGYVPTTLQTFR